MTMTMYLRKAPSIFSDLQPFHLLTSSLGLSIAIDGKARDGWALEALGVKLRDLVWEGWLALVDEHGAQIRQRLDAAGLEAEGLLVARPLAGA